MIYNSKNKNIFLKILLDSFQGFMSFLVKNTIKLFANFSQLNSIFSSIFASHYIGLIEIFFFVESEETDMHSKDSRSQKQVVLCEPNNTLMKH